MASLIFSILIAVVTLVINYFSSDAAAWFVWIVYFVFAAGFLFKSFSRYSVLRAGGSLSHAEIMLISHVPFSSTITLLIAFLLLFVDISKFHLLWIAPVLFIFFEFTIGLRTARKLVSADTTPLLKAIEENDSIDVVKLLIEQGENVNVKDDLGHRPLHKAVLFNAIDVAAMLIKHDADVDARDENGKTSLHAAALKDFFAIARLLLENGAEVDARSKNGVTPLHCAAQNTNQNMARLLIEHEADVNAEFDSGITPLQLVAKSSGDKVELAKLLIENGANTTGIDLS